MDEEERMLAEIIKRSEEEEIQRQKSIEEEIMSQVLKEREANV